MIGRISLSQWAIFDAVIEHGGYYKAAKALNRSHSSLHHAVAKIQQQLGVDLLVIDGKTPVLTKIGEVIHRRAKRLLQESLEIEELAVKLSRGWESEITVAVENIFPKSLLQPALKHFHKTNHITRLRILDVVLSGAMEMIETAEADIVITPIVPSGFIGTPLLTVTLLPFAHKDHPLNKMAQPATQRDLIEHLQIVIKDTGTVARKMPTGWLRAEKRWTVSDFYHAREILLSGDGFCWMPEHFLKTSCPDHQIKQIQTEGELARAATLYLVTSKGENAGPGVELLARLIREEARRGL
ncbi:LysR family transcriptional regulator [Sneathiella glossodoripedis]|uniref:LysR family transcriptional regulator n=1 Tax=Sneathiella glossodoripedis TaxID=418853 RepID=UPI0004709C04|nr:LysR family transcriptional regulator [Sneathiella glossodoripedis]